MNIVPENYEIKFNMSRRVGPEMDSHSEFYDIEVDALFPTPDDEDSVFPIFAGDMLTVGALRATLCNLPGSKNFLMSCETRSQEIANVCKWVYQEPLEDLEFNKVLNNSRGFAGFTYISSINVSEKHRGKNLGLAMMRELVLSIGPFNTGIFILQPWWNDPSTEWMSDEDLEKHKETKEFKDSFNASVEGLKKYYSKFGFVDYGECMTFDPELEPKWPIKNNQTKKIMV